MSFDKMTKAKSALVLDQPFFASILLSMTLEENAAIPTFATDGESIQFNPDFAKSLTHEELVFILGHEVLHCVFEHMTRRNGRDPNQWNIAADLVINDVLVKERIGKMPAGGLLDSALVAKAGGTTEAVYSALGNSQPPQPPQSKQGKPGNPGKQSKQGKGSGQGKPGKGAGKPQPSKFPGAGEPGGALDQVIDAAPDQATQAAKAAKMRVKVVQARNAAKMQGQLSAGLDRLISELTKPRVDWKDVLRRFLSTRAKVDWSFAKPKRRFLADDLLLPSLAGERLGKIAVAIDCSGSIGQAELDGFAAEIRAIAEDCKPESLEVIYFDAEVLGRQSFGPDDEIKLEPMGGGGTAFSPVFAALAKDADQPVACVILTDLRCNDFGPAPAFPVLWVSTDSETAPWGEITKISKGE